MNESRESMFTIIKMRTGIVVIFLALFGFFLYSPKMYDYFFERANTIHVYTFLDVIAPEIFDEFTEKTGVQVTVNYFETNEELFAKIKINRGLGYDLIVASDYMIEIMCKDGMLAKLDHEKIINAKELDPRLLNRSYDPGNTYSFPVCWIPYGIGYNINEHQLSAKKTDWGVVFKPTCDISMLDDAREAISLACLYACGRVDPINSKQRTIIKDMLIAQKKHVAVYAESGAQYVLVSNIASLAVLPSGRMKRLIEDDPQFAFFVPRSGSLLTIENLAIPAASKKQEQAHQLLNFLLKREYGALNFDAFGFNPANRFSYRDIDKMFYTNKSFFPDDEIFSHLHTISTAIPIKTLEEIWFAVKSA